MNIAVIGTGYVGLVSGTCFAEIGSQVICVDNDPVKLKKMQNAEVPIYEPGLEVLFLRNIEKKRLIFTDNLKEAVLKSEVIFLCLPTPQGGDGAADLQYVMKAAADIADILLAEGSKDYKILVNKSTVPVGTSRKVEKILSDKGVTNFDIVSNPEFLREGFAVEDFMKPDRIVIGARSEKALQIMRNLYEPFVRQGNPILDMDNESSEVTKYAANSYLAMRITFMNELANFCEKAGADVDLIRKGMGSDSRIGKRFLFPGIGYGGSCFPKDVNALIKTARDFDSELNILTVVDKVNKAQKQVLVKKVQKMFGEVLKGRHFAIWGLAFKPNTDDMRDAPSITIINMLLDAGATVAAYDPAAAETSKYFFGDRIRYAVDEYDALTGADALLVLTEWNEFRNPDFTRIKAALKNNVIFDGRNVFSVEKMQEVGMVYHSIGRKPIE
ncbi:MAG: UDP-glucose/GDP-mannose dehydrogenase family protein [Ignavibacteria bacterium]|nr:UDP-glucose/GDP-mannose dehydrogenase family protein [Ignavibacteria bacterium]